MQIRILLLLLISILIVSCSQKQEDRIGLQLIDLKDSKDILPISTFIEKVEYVKLEIPDESYQIGEILSVKEIGSDILLRHRKAKEISIVRFTKEGKFVNVVAANSNGQLKTPLDIIDYKNGYAVLDQTGIFHFSKDGKMKKKLVSAKVPGERFFHEKDKFYVLDETSMNGHLAVYSANGKILMKDNSVMPVANPGMADIISLGQGRQLIVSAKNDTVFEFSKQKLKPKYAFTGSSVPSLMKGLKHIDRWEFKKARKYLNNNQHMVLKNYLENDNYIYITYWAGSNATNVLIKKGTQEYTFWGYGVNNIDGGIWDKPFYLTEKDELIVPVKASKVAGHTIRNKYRKDFEKLQEQIKIDDGPVIMKCKLK